MNLLELQELYINYVVIGLAAFSCLSLLLIIILFIKSRKLNKKYKKFMSGAGGESLESQFLRRFNELDELKIQSKKITNKLEIVSDNLLLSYQKVGIVKYDAFKEMGGKLSFALALLNANNDGFILNSMHSSREGCYAYIKEVIKGESFIVLAEEEKIALEEAKNCRDYMN